jgi:meso-butanediol dehydrogenase/(S,S)-butanediol dehydrogenase/diacetyl reductase
MRFTGKVAIVTGSASGIGLATAVRLGEEGANLVLADCDDIGLAEAQRRILALGVQAVFCSPCDVADEDQVRQTADEAIGRFGRLDIVVNNAGVMVFKPIEEQTMADWERVLHVDLLGAFFFIKHAFRVMTHGGAIVNVSGIHALEAEPMIAPYAAAQAALLSLTRSASLEGKPREIRVNAVLPGAVDTPMLWSNPDVKSWAEKIATNDVGNPEDIAAAIAFLASTEAAFVQGAALRVDDGRLDRIG